ALKNRDSLSIREAEEITGVKPVHSLIRNLIAKGIAIPEEELKEKYKPLIVSYVRLNDEYHDEKTLQSLFDALEKKAPRQQELLISYLNLSEFHLGQKKEISRSLLLKSCENSSSALNALVKKKVLTIYETEAGRIQRIDSEKKEIPQLLDFQENALEEIREHFSEKEVVLLHGVTSSGKTEIYARLIQQAIDEGKQVLYLLPEIALTSQIINRLTKYFGANIGVYHSRFNEHERVEIWNTLMDEGKPAVILGARSALFLPFQNLGLIIVDEEHDNSFKQRDPAPRYNARDCAIYLARMHGAKTLLGSATPSVETYYNAKTNRFGLVNIDKRFGDMELPEIVISNTDLARKEKTMHSCFTGSLLDEIGKTLKQNRQVILFRNRRGFAIHVECPDCQWVPMCRNCDVALTYHKQFHQLRCHYCGYSEKLPSKCPACGSSNVKQLGYGTEKIEEELSIFFPEASIARFDLDSTRSKHSHTQILSKFEARETDILVGTQMVTKGLDFDHVALVGIINADSMLRYPDFRSNERGFQLMAQVAGRAGRKGHRGRVIIQTANPHHPVIRLLTENNFEGMYTREIAERQAFQYPPFVRMVMISLRHPDILKVNSAAKVLEKMLRNTFDKRVLGPAQPVIQRIQNQYILEFIIKLDRGKGLAPAKAKLMNILDTFKKDKQSNAVRIVVDVDPV
ncbi:MAG: primosomal protein N', partial [Bacteroidota bacterium]